MTHQAHGHPGLVSHWACRSDPESRVLATRSWIRWL